MITQKTPKMIEICLYLYSFLWNGLLTNRSKQSVLAFRNLRKRPPLVELPRRIQDLQESVCCFLANDEKVSTKLLAQKTIRHHGEAWKINIGGIPHMSHEKDPALLSIESWLVNSGILISWFMK